MTKPIQNNNLAAVFAQWFTQARANPLFWISLLGAFVVMLADQASKIWIVDVLRLPARRKIELSSIFDLTYVSNYGASFGLGAGGLPSRIILSLIVIAIIAFLVSWLAQVRRPLVAIAIAFLIGGALGNLIDRVLYGFVVDFLDFSGLMFPWVFNLADCAVNIGVGCLILDYFQHREKAE